MPPESRALAGNSSTDVQIAQMRGELVAMREVWALHTRQDMDQFDKLNSTLNDLDGKMDALLLREAERKGEGAGIKRAAIILSSVISLSVTLIGVIGVTLVN